MKSYPVADLGSDTKVAPRSCRKFDEQFCPSPYNGHPGHRFGRDTIMNRADEHPLGWLMHAQNVRRCRDLQVAQPSHLWLKISASSCLGWLRLSPSPGRKRMASCPEQCRDILARLRRVRDTAYWDSPGFAFSQKGSLVARSGAAVRSIGVCARDRMHTPGLRRFTWPYNAC
jgi:hypothetical protein